MEFYVELIYLKEIILYNKLLKELLYKSGIFLYQKIKNHSKLHWNYQNN